MSTFGSHTQSITIFASGPLATAPKSSAIACQISKESLIFYPRGCLLNVGQHIQHTALGTGSLGPCGAGKLEMCPLVPDFYLALTVDVQSPWWAPSCPVGLNLSRKIHEGTTLSRQLLTNVDLRVLSKECSEKERNGGKGLTLGDQMDFLELWVLLQKS
jgi:hypothetical protein